MKNYAIFMFSSGQLTENGTFQRQQHLNIEFNYLPLFLQSSNFGYCFLRICVVVRQKQEKKCAFVNKKLCHENGYCVDGPSIGIEVYMLILVPLRWRVFLFYLLFIYFLFIIFEDYQVLFCCYHMIDR